MAGFVKAGDGAKAVELYQELQDKVGGEPVLDGIVYGSLMKAYFLMGMEEKAMECCKEVLDTESEVRFRAESYNEVVDALPLAQQADDVVIVARIGRTRIDKLRQLGELLAENGIRPTGFAVVGTPRPHRGEYHYYGGGNSDSENGQTQRRVMASLDGES